MNFIELQQENNVKEWLKNVNGSKQTRKSYLQSMKQYTEFIGLTPEELLTEAEDEILLPKRRRKLKNHILDFREHLQNNGLADSSVKNRISCIRSFYTNFEINVPKIRGEKNKTIEENERVPTKEDLQDCLAVCDPLEKAIMLAGISSGLASNEIRNLTLKQFKDGYDPKTEICTLSLRREKTDVDFITFFSPEASRAIWVYLEYRDRPLKIDEITRKQRIEKQRTTEDSYLFIIRNVSEKYSISHDEGLRKISENAILKIYRGISEKARKNAKFGHFNYIRSHTMRKYFNSALLNAGCDSFHTEFFMGHKLDDTQAAYFRANPTALREIYQKYIPYLTIQKEIDVAESPEYIKLKNNFEIVVADNVNKTVEREELIRLNNKLETQQEEHENELEEIRKEIYYMKVENQLKLAKEKIKTASPEMIEKYDKIIKDSEELLKKNK